MRLLAFLLGWVAATAAAEPLSLEQCAARAVAAASGAADAAVLEARAAREEASQRGPLPQFSAGTAFSPPALGRAQGDWLAPGTLRTTAGIDVPFLLAGDPAPGLRAQQQLDHAVAAARLARSDAAADGVEACLRLQEAKRAVRWAAQRLEVERAARDAGATRLASAMLLPAEAAALEARVASSEATADAAEAQLIAAEGLARVVLGLPQGPLEVGGSESLEAPPPLAAHAERASATVLGAAPGSASALAGPPIQSTREHQINLFAQVGVDAQGLSGAAVFGLVGARYTTELGGGARRAARDGLAEAKDSFERARADAEARERAARAVAAAASLQAARAAIPARARELERARSSLSLVQARGELGAPLLHDEETPPTLLHAQSEVMLATGALAAARHEALLAAVELWRAAGAGEELPAALVASRPMASAASPHAAEPVEAKAAASAPVPPSPAAAFAALEGKGLWIWQTAELLDQPDRAAALWQLCRRWGFTTAYLFVGEPGDPQSPLRRAEALARLVRQARAAGLDVEALGGDLEWLEAGGRSRARALAQSVARWQREHPAEERFSALHLDVEPHSAPDWRTPSARAGLMGATVSILEEAARTVRPLPLVADVPDTLEEASAARLLAVADRVVIMAYRVRPGEAARRALPLCALAARHGKRAVVALDTAEGAEPGTTFFADPRGLFAQAQDLRANLASSPACAGGIAVHDERGLVSTLKE